MKKIDKSTRILHIVSTLNYSNGTMAVIMNYYKKIDKSKIQFDFLYMFENDKNNYENDILDLGGKVYRIKSPYNFITFKKEYNNFLKNHAKEYDVFHLHEIYFNFFFFFGISKYGIKHKIVHSHTDKYSDNFLGKIKNFLLYKTMYFVASDFFACSKSAAKIMSLPKNKEVFFLNNAIDICKYRFDENIRETYRKKLKLENCFVLGNVGRLNNQKNPFFMLDIFYEVYSKKANARLVLVGDGPLKTKLIKKAKQMRIYDKIIFFGQTKKVNEVLNIFDVFVLPSLFEGLGIVLIESQANGITTFTSTCVPQETNLSSLITYLDLKKGASYWANMILKSKVNDFKNRSKYNQLLQQSEYNIHNEIAKLENIYLKIIERGD